MSIEFPKINNNLRISGSNYGSLESKIKKATRYGKLHGLHGKTDPIIQALEEKRDALKGRGGLTSMEQRALRKRIKQIAEDKGTKFSNRDIDVIDKEILGSLNKSNIKAALQSERTANASDELAKKRGILDNILGSQKKNETKTPIKRNIIRAGRINFQTGEYEEDSLNRGSSLSISGNKRESAVGIGQQLQKDKQTSASALQQGRGAVGIGGDHKGFSTIHTDINNKK